MISAYNRSPYFQFYFNSLEKIMLRNQKYLLDLNDELLHGCLDILNIKKCILHTSSFKDHLGMDGDLDFRYGITPKIISTYAYKPYIQVFNNNEFVAGLSILDLIFNMGPESFYWL
jgi:hypothetical protein